MVNFQLHMQTSKSKNSFKKVLIFKNVGGITIPDLKLYYRALVIRAARSQNIDCRIESKNYP